MFCRQFGDRSSGHDNFPAPGLNAPTRRIGATAVAAFLVVVTGAIVTAQAPSASPLTLKQAIETALDNSVGVLLARSDVDDADAARARRFAALLPHAVGTSLVNRQNRNLAALGISIPGLPSVVGPFSYVDFRVSASEPIIDRQAFHDWKATVKQEESTRLTYQDVRDVIVRQTAGIYLACATAAAQVEAATARVETSRALEQLARDQRSQALATGVDVVRAQVQLARDRQSLLVAENASQTSLLALARFIGLDLGAPMALAEPLTFRHVDVPDIGRAIHEALDARSDYRALLTERDALTEQRQASRARRLPKLAVMADYGALGPNLTSMPGTGQIQATLSIPLFDPDRTAEERELESRIQRVTIQLTDLARGIQQDIRTAVLDTQSAEEQVHVADAGVSLAVQELTLTEDRFRNGVSDNVEVVTAQDALARARDDRIAALARHADARMALARALGATEQHYLAYLAEP